VVCPSPASFSADPAAFVLVFRAGEHTCCVPVSAVERVVPAAALEPLPEAPPALLGIVNYHGAITVVLDVRQRLGEAGGPIGLGQKLIIVHTPKRLVALLADSVADIEEIAAERVMSLAEFVPGAGKVGGTAPHGLEIIYLYDIELLLSPDEESSVATALCRREAIRA
jgi:purine-binding chemotaxis protein CheW